MRVGSNGNCMHLATYCVTLLAIPLSHFMREISYHKCWCTVHVIVFLFQTLKGVLFYFGIVYFSGCVVILSQVHGNTFPGAWLRYPVCMVIYFLGTWLYFPGRMVVLSWVHGYTFPGTCLFYPRYMVILSQVHGYTVLGVLLYFPGYMVILMSQFSV